MRFLAGGLADYGQIEKEQGCWWWIFRYRYSTSGGGKEATTNLLSDKNKNNWIGPACLLELDPFYSSIISNENS